MRRALLDQGMSSCLPLLPLPVHATSLPLGPLPYSLIRHFPCSPSVFITQVGGVSHTLPLLPFPPLPTGWATSTRSSWQTACSTSSPTWAS